MFKQHTIIVDDFYPDPMAVRNLALSMPRNDLNRGNYAGIMTDEQWFTQRHLDIFRHLTNEPLETNKGQGLNGRFRFSKACDSMTQYVHYDPAPGQIWAGVVYLSLPEHLDQYEKQNQCGTAFWKHTRTGLDCIPIEESMLQQYGWHTVDDLKTFLETDGLDESLWTKTMYVPARFNRLILFRPWHFHSPGWAFGDSWQNCRLVQVFFLQLSDT